MISNKRGFGVDKVKCNKCKKEHDQRNENCCWIECECGTKICGMCGSSNIVNMEIEEADDEDEFWCCLECADCGLEGCGMCI